MLVKVCLLIKGRTRKCDALQLEDHTTREEPMNGLCSPKLVFGRPPLRKWGYKFAS